uniref:CreCAP-ShK4 n=1 Tax=Colubraria reticulata TaxID=604273 RepID=A0A481SMK7_9CAEN|nr:CreCAP-ShK4 [Colubraria reticulata]
MALMVLWVFAGVVSVQGGRGSVMGSDRGRMSSRRRRGIQAATVQTCTEQFRSIPGHTMCKQDHSGVWKSGVSSTERNEIVHQHNEARRHVYPSATDLTPLMWNAELAAVAQKWAKQCVFGHDEERSVPSLGMSVGQNMAANHKNWQLAIQGWHDEVDMYNYGPHPDTYLGKDGWKKVGHYTQMVQNTTHLVGCGFAACRKTKYERYYVCNYAAAQSRLGKPYTLGSPCLACPNNCQNGLCNCGSRICLNGGTLNLRTCSCECPSVYKGEHCEELHCPREDPTHCSKSSAGECTKYVNVRNVCPYLCGLCKAEIFTSITGCMYHGQRATLAQCKSYGDKGADKSFCLSQGGSYGCSSCTESRNFREEYCPVQCGLCDPPCGGKVCKNKGQLDLDTCECKCNSISYGDNCEHIKCPVVENDWCKSEPSDFCTRYYNGPELCPYKCGLC